MASSASQPFQPIDFRTRFPALDGVRALAILLVFADHYGGGGHGGIVLQWINLVREKGWVGVDIFFVLSGFLITGILYDTLGDSRYMSRFFARRSLRILPLYYGVFLVFLLLTPFLQYQWKPQHLWFLVYMGNVAANANFSLYLIFSKNHLPWSANISHFWSLCVEEQFYLFWPWLVYLIRDRKRLIAVAIALSLFALASRFWFLQHFGPAIGETWIMRALPFRLDSLLIGGVLALLLRGPKADRIQRSCKWVLIGAGAAVLAIFVQNPSSQSPLLLTVGLSLLGIAAAGLIGVTLRTGSPAFRLFSLKPLRTLGKYSYGFYVFHDLFYFAWLQLLIYLGAKLGGKALPGTLAITFAFVVYFLISKLSYDLFESRFLRYKRHFEYDLERTSHKHAFRS